jgi:splicing factor 3A subunit 3
MLRHGKLERTLDVRDKMTQSYLEYAQTLYNYLVSFFERALPLMDIRQKLKDAVEDFETAWEAGRVEGWNEGSSKPVSKAVQGNGDGIWCQYCQLAGIYARPKADAPSRSKELFKADRI